MKIKRKIYISDLDGTLLLPDRTVGEYSRRVLLRFIEDGGLFTVATGRGAASSAAILHGIPLPLPAIVNNGALTVDLGTGQVHDVRSLSGEDAARLFSAAIAAGLSPVAYALDIDEQSILFHAPNPNPATGRYLDQLPALQRTVLDMGERLAGQRGLSILILDLPERLKVFLAEHASREDVFTVHLGRSAYTPGLGVAEIQAPGATKGVAALEIARKLGLTAVDIVAFGDNANDLPLLRCAGQAHCPPSSDPAVLDAVPCRIARPEEEGVAHFLDGVQVDPGAMGGSAAVS